MVRKENSMYTACPKDGCNKKVVDQGNGMYRCEKCNESYDSFQWRIMLGVSLPCISEDCIQPACQIPYIYIRLDVCSWLAYGISEILFKLNEMREKAAPSSGLERN